MARIVVDNSGKLFVVEGMADGEYSFVVTDESRIIIKPSVVGGEKSMVIKDGKCADKSLLLILSAGEYDEVNFIMIDDAYYQVMAS